MRATAISCVLVTTVLAVVPGCGDRPPSSSPSSGGGGSQQQTTTGSQGAGAAPQGSPACGKAGARSGILAQHVPVFGKSRSYTLVVPATYAPTTSYPLIYVLHGNGGSGAQARAAFDLESAANGNAIFLYPDGVGGGWDLDSPASKNPDVALFDATLAITQGAYCIDLHRVFVAGFSNGAYMANQLACRRGERIRAVATHAGGGPYEAVGGEYDEQGHLVCNRGGGGGGGGSGKAVGSLVVHGLSDGTVVPGEGQKSLEHWTFANHCGGSAPSSPSGCVAFQGCANPVVACKVPGHGHAVWGQAKGLTWSFFDAQK